MLAWYRLAWIEWYRAFAIRQPGGGSGKRDFFWLSLLLWLTLTLALFVWGSRAGLLDQFVNVSLGYVRGYGIPIWVIANPESSDSTAIGRQVLQSMRALAIPGIHAGVQPYREVERYAVSLPDSYERGGQIWGNKPEAFYGWAVSPQDPLWRMAMLPTTPAPSENSAPHPFPLEVILSHSVFQRYFNCQAYGDVLAHKLPAAMQPPEQNVASNDKLACLANGQLWLEAKLGTGRELVPFRIHWQRRIPTMTELAFLFPLTTLYALKMTHDNPALRYFPEGYGQQVPRVKQMRIWDTLTPEPYEERYARLASCLGNARIAKNLIMLTHSKPLQWVETCATQHQMRVQMGSQPLPEPFLKVVETEDSHALSYEAEDSISLPCHTLKSDWQKLFGCTAAETRTVTIDVLTAFGGYLKALVYVPQRTYLFPALHALQTLPRPGAQSAQQQALYVDPVYQDAIARFGFMSDVLDILGRRYGVFFVIFLLVLLGVQIGIVIGHRRHNYGVFLAKGMSWNQIRIVVLMQMTLSVVAGFCGALLGLLLLRFSLHVALTRLLASERYNERIFSTLELLPLSGGDYVVVGCTVLFLAYAMALLLLVSLCPTWRIEPSRLLHT